MNVESDPVTRESLTSLLSEARAEADALRTKLQTCERALLSSRLIMGHELKRPATAISGYLDLALEELESGNTGAAIAVIEKAKNECGLLNELNTFFLELIKEGGSGDQKEEQAVNIRNCLEEIIGHLAAELDAGGRIHIQVPPTAEEARLDPKAFKIIMLNVIENALLYSEDRMPVSVSVEKTPNQRDTDEGNLVKIEVTDRGVGIPDDCVDRIFRPFVRLTADREQGTGLGLTLVRSLVELHGGSVHVRSVEGHGTCLCITVPEVPARNGGAFVS
ncbi:MAG: HAMP domain-containing sensor histidine kinase [bacterium]